MAFNIGYPSPGSITQNLDTVLTLAFANSGNVIFDNISRSNPIFYEAKKNGMYEPIDTPDPYIEVPLMYGLGSMEWYEGWDTLGTQPTEGITAAVYPWRQAACAAGYNRREARVTAQQKIKEISKVKIEQAQLTMIDGFNKAFFWGNVQSPGGNIYTPIVSSTTSRSGIEPIGELIQFSQGVQFAQITTTTSVGGLTASSNSWWANWSHDAGSTGQNITTYAAFLAAVDQMIEQTALGVGGQPDLIICDPTTRRLLNSAYYTSYRRLLEKDNDYPFDNLMFRGAHVISDQDVPNCGANAAAGSTDTSVATGLGSMYFVNSKFYKIKYDSQCNFILTDLQKPVNQDGKIGHVMWMGNGMVTNRRKHGVMGNIARTMS